MKLIGAVAVQHTKKKKTDCVLRISTFNDKNPLYLPIIPTLYFFEGQSDQGVTQLVIELFEIPQSSRITSLSLKKCQVFRKPLLFFICFFRQYLT